MIDINLNEFITNILKRPGMYVQSKESLEDVMWALNICRGTSIKYHNMIRQEIVKRNGGCGTLASVSNTLEEIAEVLRSIEKRLQVED